MSRSGLALGLLSAVLCLTLTGAASAQNFQQPLGPDPGSGFQPIGDPLRVAVTDSVNPLYMTIHLKAGALKNVAYISIVDRTARKEVHRFTRADFQSQLAGAPEGTEFVFGKNITFRRPEKRSNRVLMVTLHNERDRPIRSSAFAFTIEPHPSETLAAEVSYQTFNDIAQIEFQDACRSFARRGAAPGDVILIGETEQEFPSLGYLTKIQKQESLRGYFEGCTTAYAACSRTKPQDPNVQEFCATKRDELRQEVFSRQ